MSYEVKYLADTSQQVMPRWRHQRNRRVSMRTQLRGIPSAHSQKLSHPGLLLTQYSSHINKNACTYTIQQGPRIAQLSPVEIHVLKYSNFWRLKELLLKKRRQSLYGVYILRGISVGNHSLVYIMRGRSVGNQSLVYIIRRRSVGNHSLVFI